MSRFLRKIDDFQDFFDFFQKKIDLKRKKNFIIFHINFYCVIDFLKRLDYEYL